MRFHIPSIPGQPTVYTNSTCAYTQKIMKFMDMMIPRGHEVYVYSGPEFNQPRKATEGFKHFNVYEDAVYNGFNIAEWLPHNSKAIPVIEENFQEGDFLLLIAGLAQKSISDAIDTFRVVEFGIGYQGVFAEYKVWESYAWMHTVNGENQGAYAADGSWYDTVIPNYFDADDFENIGEGDYYLYIGRLLERKGVRIAAQVCEKLGVPLKIAGEGDECLGLYGEYVGKVGPEERKELMGNAIGVFAPSIYMEPFGGVVVEAMLSGTPVLSNDWGAMTETIKNGETGFRCKTFGDYLAATKLCPSLDREAIREYAIDHYSLEAVAPQYESFFKQVDDLAGKGWYTEESYNF